MYNIKIVPTNIASPFPCQGLIIYRLGRGARLDVEPQEARPEQAAQHRGHADDGRCRFRSLGTIVTRGSNHYYHTLMLIYLIPNLTYLI